MSRLTLDAGALIALERSDRTLWAALRLAATASHDVVVPTTVVAQVWRGTAGQALLSRALQHCVLAPFDPRARAVGELCGRTRTRDLCDAHVALVASEQGGVLYTSDPEDLGRLVAALGGRTPRILRC
ncbi:MAG: PIN domain nuclease [Deltaproteobacteria bacterium]|nr:PIN domain nuclease [Deltaproteobacteria bacterium]